MDVLQPWYAEQRVVEDLNYLLRDGLAQSIALKELGIELVEPGISLQFAAFMVIDDVTLVARGWGAPAEAIDRVRQMLANEYRLRVGFRSSIPLWAVQLGNMFSLNYHERDHGRELEEHPRARLMLRFLDLEQDIPEAFRNPSNDHLDRAERLLASLKVSPSGSRAGRERTPWGAAVAFAACFGVALPDRLRDARAEWARGEE